MLAGPVILAAFGALFGLYPGLLERALVAPMVISLTGSENEVKELKLWAGVNLPLALSIATFGLGLVFYAAHGRLRAAIARVFDAIPSLDRGWEGGGGGGGFMTWLKVFAGRVTRVIQTGRMTDYLAITFATIAGGLAAAMISRGLPNLDPAFGAISGTDLALAGLILAGAALAAFTRSRITAIAALGVVGIGTALVFIVFGAPDVAITQLMVEVLVVVLVAVVMLRLPRLESATDASGPAMPPSLWRWAPSSA